MERHVTGDAGVVDQNLDRAQVGLDLRHGGGDGVEIADIEFIDGDPRFVLELGGGFVVARVVGGDGIAL